MATFGRLVKQAADDDAENWKRARYSVFTRLLIFMGLCGLRQAEAAGLGWDHVSIDEPVDEGLRVNPPNDLLVVEWQAARGWQSRHADRPRDIPKDGARRLRLHPVVRKLLRDQRVELVRRGWYRGDGPVWPGLAGRWLETGRVLSPERIKKWARLAGLPNWEKWCGHSLRHTAIMLEIVACNGDLISVMQRSGHSDLRIVRGYMHSMGGQLPPSRIELSAGDAEAMMPALDGDSVDGMRLLEAPPLDLPDESILRAEAEQHRTETKRAKHAATYDTLEAVYRRWVAAGKPGDRPIEITERARRHYMKGYNQAKREGRSKAKCAAEGKLERGQFLGAWGRACARLGKKVQTNNEQ
jgi:hypothetical protein